MRAILLIEDNFNRESRRLIPGLSNKSRHSVLIRLHHLSRSKHEVVAEQTYRTGCLGDSASEQGKAEIALKLLDSILPLYPNTIIVAGPEYGCKKKFIRGVLNRNLDFTAEIRPSTIVKTCNNGCDDQNSELRKLKASVLLPKAYWQTINLAVPIATSQVQYQMASLANIALPSQRKGLLFAAQTGGIQGVHPGTILAVSTLKRLSLRKLMEIVGWARWIRPRIRKKERDLQEPVINSNGMGNKLFHSNSMLKVRSNISTALHQDQHSSWIGASCGSLKPRSRGKISSLTSVFRVVELFAGAGGMGLGFLLSRRSRKRYRLIYSAEVHPIYVETLNYNHERFIYRRRGPRTDHIPEQIKPIDLTATRSISKVESIVREAGGVNVLVGGPPCQGFSSANRNSWHPSNPHNQMVEIFLKYVKRLRPPIFLMENVPGIAWTPKDGGSRSTFTFANDFLGRMATAGYLVFPKMLDAVWYGVPQFRSRFFVLGIHRDLGYKADDFGDWGPFPYPTHGPGTSLPYTTVREAIADLPPVPNGHNAYETPYSEPSSKDLKRNPYLYAMRTRASKNVVLDHLTSRHADYVIERYRQIPPGGNWRNIAHTLTNYTEVSRTHSNIYRRLTWDEPSITIGHYRKSMIVHPDQHRGLSIREAARLQSFPDWFQFRGKVNGKFGGLSHKQQQLANAVCPLLTKALADFILRI